MPSPSDERIASRHITPNRAAFFAGEIVNEGNGGVSPSTLASSADSLSQGGADTFGLNADDLVALAAVMGLVPNTTEVRWLLAARALDPENDAPADEPDNDEIFYVEIEETTNYRHAFTRADIIQYVGEDTLSEHLGLNDQDDLADVSDQALVDAIGELGAEGMVDSLEEEMQAYGDVQQNSWNISLRVKSS